MSIEIWKNILDYDGVYQVSNYGKVRSTGMWVVSNNSNNGLQFKKGKPLKQFKDKAGYHKVTLCYKGRKQKFVHHLVLETFHSKRPHNKECCHNDGNPSNNFISNLRWGTHLENNLDKETYGRPQVGSRTSNAKLLELQVVVIKQLINHQISLKEIAKKFQVGSRTIFDIKKGRTWKHVTI